MTSSTPPAWAWLDVPIAYPANALSIHSRKVPDSATLREQNDSPGCDVSCSPDISCDRKDDAPGCDEAAQVTNAQSNAGPEHVKSYVSEHPSWVCNDCGQDRYGKPNGMSTWHYDYCRFCGEFVPCTEPRDFGDRLGDRHDGEPVETHWACPACAGLQGGHDCGQNEEPASETHEDLQGKDADSFVVTSCPECGSVTDIDYGTVKDKPPDCQAYGEREADKVPFSAQEWMFESLCEEKLPELPHLIFTHSERIVEMARDRFRRGYAKYGSAAYRWDAETRLTNVLEELADSVVYLTTGPIE